LFALGAISPEQSEMIRTMVLFFSTDKKHCDETLGAKAYEKELRPAHPARHHTHSTLVVIQKWNIVLQST